MSNEKEFTELVKAGGMPTTQAEADAKWREKLDESNVVISNQVEFSPFWRLLNAIVTQPLLWLVSVMVKQWLPNSFVQTASGVFLDMLAQAVNVQRKPATKAVGRILFQRSNASAIQTIPVGTPIDSAPINGVTYRMITTQEAVFQAGQNSLYVEAEASEAGQAHNLTAGAYVLLDAAIAGSFTAINTGDWLLSPGSDRETDEDLRDRTKNQFPALNQWHIDGAYKAIITEYSGVHLRNIFVEKDAPRGPGTANFYILLDIGEPSLSFLGSIQNHIMAEGNHGHGDDIQVMAMPKRYFYCTVDVWFNSDVGAAERSQLKLEIENMIRSAFRENNNYQVTRTEPNSRFSFSRLGEEMHQQFPQIKDIDFASDRLPTDWWVPRLNGVRVNTHA